VVIVVVVVVVVVIVVVIVVVVDDLPPSSAGKRVMWMARSPALGPSPSTPSLPPRARSKSEKREPAVLDVGTAPAGR
jgi:hypothetical protein